MATQWVVHCDGSAVPNPGRMGLGALLVDPEGTRHLMSRSCSGTGCNNEAEVRAFIAALNELKALGANALVAYSDSSILVEQLAGAEVEPIARLAPLYEAARAALAAFEYADVRWIPGHRNGEADALARAALGMPPRPVPRLRLKRRR